MNKFDRILWRINGVIFLALLLYGLLTTIWMSTLLRHGPPLQHPPTTADAPTPQAVGSGSAPLHLANPMPITGTPFVRASFETDHEDGKYRGGWKFVYNYLYFSTTDLSSGWLFERTDKLITGVHDLYAEGDGPEKRVVATVFELVPADTDGDGRLTQADREAIYFCGPDGKKPIEIVPPTDGMQSIQQLPHGQVLITYRRADALIAALFSADDGSKIKEAALPTKPGK